MDINLLVLNSGNSRLAIRPFIAGEPGPVVRLGNDQQIDWPQAIEQAWKLVHGNENAAIAAAGVNPAMMTILDDAAMAVAGQKIEWIGRDISLPIKVLTD